MVSLRFRNRWDTIAFTLIETLVAIGIIGLLIGVAVSSFSGKSGKIDSATVAKIVGDLLVQTRSRAAAIGQPTGIAFPGTSTVYAQSYYRLSGRSLMTIEGQNDWSAEFPLVYLSWGATGSETLTPRLSHQSYDLTSMTGFDSDDPVLLFTPSGEVLTRGLPFDGTYYHLRVGSSPAGGSSALSGMNQTWDIRIDHQGNILVDRDNSFAPGGGSSLPNTDTLPPASAPPGTLPVVLSVTTPQELTDTGSGLSIATLDEAVQLVTEADSPSGLPLSVRWSSDGGQFTDDSEWLPMTYSPDDDRWKSSISWSLPAVPAATQTVSVEVRDRYNNVSADTALSRVIFDTSPRVDAHIFFVSRTNSSTISSIETINGDGSGRRALLENLPSGPALAASPSGQFLAWLGDGLLNNNQVAISDTEGTILHTVTLPRNLSYDITWSDDSRRVIVNDRVSPTTMWSIDPSDGSYSTFIAFTEEVESPTVSGNLEKIVYTKPGSNDILYCYDTTSSSESVIYTAPNTSSRVGTYHISRAGNYCGFIVSQGASSRSMIAATDGSPAVDLGLGSHPTISPDEATAVFINRDGAPKVVVTAIDGTVIYEFPSFNGPNATEKQHVFTPDSAHIVFQAGVWFDHRLMAIEVASGNVLELLKSDNLNKFSPQAVSNL